MKEYIFSFEAFFCNKCKKFFSERLANCCSTCHVCTEDLCIISVKTMVNIPAEVDTAAVVESIEIDAIQGYVKPKDFYNSKTIFKKATEHFKTDDFLKEQFNKTIQEEFGFYTKKELDNIKESPLKKE